MTFMSILSLHVGYFKFLRGADVRGLGHRFSFLVEAIRRVKSFVLITIQLGMLKSHSSRLDASY